MKTDEPRTLRVSPPRRNFSALILGLLIAFAVSACGIDDSPETPAQPRIDDSPETPAQPPPPPSQVRAVQEGLVVRISWDPVPDVIRYRIHVCNEDDLCEVLGRSAGETSFVHEPPFPQPRVINVIDRSDDALWLRWPDVHGGVRKLQYYVVACDQTGCSSTDERPIAARVSYAVVGRYQLHRRSVDSQYAVVRDDLTLAQYVDEGLEPSTVYYYTVQFCHDAKCSALSDEMGGLTESDGPVDPPSPPTGFQGQKIDISLGGDDAWVSWFAVEGATYYEVHQGPDVFDLDAQISAPQTSFYDDHPNRDFFGGYYTTSWKVRACNKAGCSPFSDVVTLD